MKIKEYNQMKEELIKDDRGDSTGAFRNFVREQRALDQEPRNMELAKAEIPRHLWDNFNTPNLEQSPDSFLRPGETLEDFDVNFRRPNAQGGRIGFGDGGSPPKWSGTKNLPFAERDAWRKKFVNDLVKWIVKKIKKFNKTALPGEVAPLTTNDILRDMGYSPSEGAGAQRKSPPTTLRNYIEEAFTKVPKQHKFVKDQYGFRTQKVPRKGEVSLSTKFKDKALQFFRNNFKNMSITQMAEKLTGKLSHAGKKGYNLEVQTVKEFISRFKNYLIDKNVISEGDVFTGKGGLRPDVKGLDRLDKKWHTKTWEKYRKDFLDLVKKDPTIYKDPKFKAKSTGKFGHWLFDKYLKLDLLNNGLIDEFLGAKWPAMLRPSFEHIQGITPGRIIDDPSVLRKVDLQTTRYNWKAMGATSKNYANVKQGLNQAVKLLKKNNINSATKALNVINEIYDSVGKEFKLNRKELPKYSIKNKQIKETNLKGIIKPQTIEKSFLRFFEKVANQATDAELKKIQKVNPKAYKIINSLRNGDIKSAQNSIKVVLPKDGPSLRSFIGALDTSMFPNIQLSPALTEAFGNVAKVGGKVLKGAGVVGWAAEPVFAAYNFSDAIGEGLSGKEAGIYTGAKFVEDVVNIPGMVVGAVKWGKGKLTGEDTPFETPYDVTFARDWKEKTAEAIPENVKLRRAAEIKFDNTIGANMRMVDDMDIPASREEIEIARNNFLKEKLGENYQVTHPKDVEKEKKIDPLASIFDPIPKIEFAGGGRAGLSGSSTSGRPPESGPQSGGLPSLYNNVRKW